jgi:folate-binding protein YgfZ
MKNLFIPLKKRCLIKITGTDKRSFLQGLLTRNLEDLTEAQPIYALLLSPQGKYLSDFFIVEKDDSFFCDIPVQEKDTIIKRLTMYKLRSDVAIEDISSEYDAVALIGENVEQHVNEGQKVKTFCKGVVYSDPRTAKLGARAFIETENNYQSFIVHDFEQSDVSVYEQIRIENKVADDSDLEANGAFPLDYELDSWGAIDFDKGCYVGQEVTARMHHKSTRKKGVYKVTASALPNKGDNLLSQTKNKAGIMLSSYNGVGLALLKHEDANKSPSLQYEGSEIVIATN